MNKRNIFILALVAIVAVAAGALLIFYKTGPQGSAISPDQNVSSFEGRGLVVETLKEGTGAEATKTSRVTINYTGRLQSGAEFDSKSGFSFTFGDGTVLKAWESGIEGMKVGGIRRLTIGPALAYGEHGIPGLIPPNATVIFEIKLVKIE